jgi:hypothetical protein
MATMTRCRLLLIGHLAVIAVLCVASLLFWPRPSAINRENFERLEIGMALADVETILGGPARNESTGPLTSDEPEGAVAGGPETQLVLVPDGGWVSSGGGQFVPPAKQWLSNTQLICVSLDHSGRVESCHAVPVRRMQEPPLETLRRWLRL